jgi:hypothetical protein
MPTPPDDLDAIPDRTSLADIAHRYEVSVATVRRWLEDHWASQLLGLTGETPAGRDADVNCRRTAKGRRGELGDADLLGELVEHSDASALDPLAAPGSITPGC